MAKYLFIIKNLEIRNRCQMYFHDVFDKLVVQIRCKILTISLQIFEVLKS